MFFLGCCFVASYAQDYPSTQNPEGNVPANQQDLGFISDTHVLFDATGGTDSHIQVTCKDGWFSVNDNDWLEVSENGDYLVVHCRPNPNPRARSGQISIIGAKGTRTGNITVQQQALGSSPSKFNVQTNTTTPTVEKQPLPVKASFEAGMAAPTFENVWNILRLLESNDNLKLQIEMPWCRNEYSINLMEKRIQNLTDYFIASGIDKNRISQHIILIDADKGDTDCDCAHLKIVE